MRYHRVIILKNGASCTLRHGTGADAAEVLENFRQTHAQTDYLLSYPDEIHFTLEQEADFLDKKQASDREAEILALVDGRVVGSAGFESVGEGEKVRHRADFGISVDRAYWGLGIGRALTEACIECATRAGYTQVELMVVAENKAAIALYESVGFRTYGCNPKGFRSRTSGWQELLMMRLECAARET